MKLLRQTQNLQDKRETCNTNANDLTCGPSGDRRGLVGNSSNPDTSLNHAGLKTIICICIYIHRISYRPDRSCIYRINFAKPFTEDFFDQGLGPMT